MRLLKGCLGVSGIFLLLFVESNAFALTTLKKIQVTDNSQVDLFFDDKVSVHQIKTEYINDIVQLSISDVSIYPAKITSISGADLTKVFAYQYAPKLVRCRFSVKGKAEDYKKRISVKANGKLVSFRVNGVAASSDHILSSAAAPARSVSRNSGDQGPTAKVAKAAPAPVIQEAKVAASDEEKALLERVLKSSEPPSAKTGASASFGKPLRHAREPLAGGKQLPSPWRAIGMLMVVLSLFLGLMMFLKKRGNIREIQNHKGLRGIVGELARNMGGGLGLSGKRKMVEVLATHYLGPKKSIAVVRIAGRVLVLGVTQESVNLITEMGAFPADEEQRSDGRKPSIGASDLEDLGFDFLAKPAEPRASRGAQAYAGGSGAVAAGPAAFSDILSQENERPGSVNARAKIRSRLEGLKPL